MLDELVWPMGPKKRKQMMTGTLSCCHFGVSSAFRPAFAFVLFLAFAFPLVLVLPVPYFPT
jgi:hypothetical protein